MLEQAKKKQHNTPSKIICIGRNYADHAKELGNDVPTEPLIFFKPPSSINHTDSIDLIDITSDKNLGELHYECELCVQIGKRLHKASYEEAKQGVSLVTLGLDLTLRDIQNKLKAKGHPWERAKAFDNACVLGEWLDVSVLDDFKQTEYQLCINNEVRQEGNTSLMLFPIIDLLVEISQNFTLEVGDIIMTGTPSGVGALAQGDEVTMSLNTNQGQKIWKKYVQ